MPKPSTITDDDDEANKSQNSQDLLSQIKPLQDLGLNGLVKNLSGELHAAERDVSPGTTNEGMPLEST